MRSLLLVITVLTAALADSLGGRAAESPSFEPGDISIGEPIALPFAGGRTGAANAEPPPLQPSPQPYRAPGAGGGPPGAGAGATDDLTPIRDRLEPLRSLPPAVPSAVPQGLPASNAAPAATRTTGQGWLGLAVAESSVAGRWIVATVAPVGPAAEAGILPGDEVRGINGLPLRNADEVSQAITAIAPGQVVGMAIARGEQVRDVQLTATARPSVAPFAAAPPLAPAAAAVVAAPETRPAPADLGTPPAGIAPAEVFPAAPPLERGVRPAAGVGGGRTALGVRTLPVDEAVQSRYRLPDASGAYVVGVVHDLPASKAGVPPGSVIISLDARPVRSPDELTRLVTSGPVGRPVSLEYVLPGGASQRADVVLQTLEKPLEEALVGSPEPLATGIPNLEPSPASTIARRPISQLDAGSAAAIRDEIRWLRARLTILEQRLETEDR